MVEHRSRGLFLTNLSDHTPTQSSTTSLQSIIQSPEIPHTTQQQFEETFEQFEARIDDTLEKAKKLLREGRRDTQLLSSELQ